MGSPTTIHPFPELLALAEEEARAYATTSDGTRHEAIELYARVRFTLMLCDLQRNASRDAVARLVAARLGMVVGSTAPRLGWSAYDPGSTDCDGAPMSDGWPEGWWLDCGTGDLLFFTSGEWCPSDCVSIPGLPGMGRDAEALAVIVRHLWPQESP